MAKKTTKKNKNTPKQPKKVEILAKNSTAEDATKDIIVEPIDDTKNADLKNSGEAKKMGKKKSGGIGKIFVWLIFLAIIAIFALFFLAPDKFKQLKAQIMPSTTTTANKTDINKFVQSSTKTAPKVSFNHKATAKPKAPAKKPISRMQVEVTKPEIVKTKEPIKKLEPTNTTQVKKEAKQAAITTVSKPAEPSKPTEQKAVTANKNNPAKNPETNNSKPDSKPKNKPATPEPKAQEAKQISSSNLAEQNLKPEEYQQVIKALENKIIYNQKKLRQVKEQSERQIKDLEAKLAETAKQRNIALAEQKTQASQSSKDLHKNKIRLGARSLKEESSASHIRSVAKALGAEDKVSFQLKKLEEIEGKKVPTKAQFLDYLINLKPMEKTKEDIPEGRALWNKLQNFPGSFIRVRDKKDVEKEKAQKVIIKDIAIGILSSNYSAAQEDVKLLDAELYPATQISASIADIQSREKHLKDIKRILGN